MCALGKQYRTPFLCSAFHAEERLELTHRDICGPISPATPAGNKYFLLIIDYASLYMWVEVLKRKDEALKFVKKVKALAENELGLKMKAFRTDRGGEFNSLILLLFPLLTLLGYMESVSTSIFSTHPLLSISPLFSHPIKTRVTLPVAMPRHLPSVFLHIRWWRHGGGGCSNNTSLYDRPSRTPAITAAKLGFAECDASVGNVESLLSSVILVWVHWTPTVWTDPPRPDMPHQQHRSSSSLTATLGARNTRRSYLISPPS